VAPYCCFAELFLSDRQVERFCVELCEAVEKQDEQLIERLLPVIKQRHDAATRALSGCLTVKDVTVLWYFSRSVLSPLINFVDFAHAAYSALTLLVERQEVPLQQSQKMGFNSWCGLVDLV